MLSVKLPRFHAGERASASQLNRMCELIEAAFRPSSSGYGSEIYSGGLILKNEKFWGRTELVQVQANIAATATTGTVLLMSFNPSASQVWQQTTIQKTLRTDTFPGMPFLAGDQFFATYHRASGMYIPINPPMARTVTANSTIAAISGANPGMGTVTLQSGTVSSGSGVMTLGSATGITATAYNESTQPVAGGVSLQMKYISIGGGYYWFIDFESCPN